MVEANSRENTVLVGKKPSMAYVLATITQFNSGKQEVFIKARGKAISRAVDVAEIVRRKFLHNVKINEIEIGTEERDGGDRGRLNVSTITITMAK